MERSWSISVNNGENQDLKIERVDESNFDTFLDLIEKLAEYERLKPPDREARVRLKQDGLRDNPRYEAYLGKLGTVAVSYVIFFQTYSSFHANPTLFLEDIFVLEEYRRKGIGQEMFEFCIRKAAELECGRMEWCVLDWNQPAIDFYEKNRAKRMNWVFYRFSEDVINRYRKE